MQRRYSQVQAMLAITKGSLRSIVRSPSAVIFSIVHNVSGIVCSPALRYTLGKIAVREQVLTFERHGVIHANIANWLRFYV